MTLAEQGAYRNLLDHSWLADPQGYLPDDDEQLAGMSGAKADWPAMRDTVMEMFKKSAKGWSNSRLQIELKKQKKRRHDARSAAKSRWGKDKEEMPEQCDRIPDASDPQSIAIASATPIAVATAEKDKRPPRGSVDWAGVVNWWNELAARYSMSSVRGLSKDRKSKWRARIAANPDFQKEVEAELANMDESNRTAQWFGFDFLLSETKALKFLEGKYRQGFGGNGSGAFTWKGKRVQVKKGTPGARYERGAFGIVERVDHKSRGKISVRVEFENPSDELKRESGRHVWYPSENVELAQ